jgi:signal transduction histidine kinase
VLVNLIKNAWEALEGHPEPRIVVRAQRAKEPGYVQISVEDNGPGIPAEIQEKVWVSFFTTKSDSGGTGLGLPACMQIAQQSHGKLWVESEEGEGATFFLWLPQADQG